MTAVLHIFIPSGQVNILFNDIGNVSRKEGVTPKILDLVGYMLFL